MTGVFTISARKSFLDVLALSLLKRTEFHPEKLQEYFILLPTRRACTGLRDAFLRHSREKALILPSINPIGDALDYDDLFWLADSPDAAGDDGLSPPLSPMKRLLVLASMVMEKAKAQGINMAPHTSFILARELAALMDEVAVEGLSWDNLENIIPDNLNTYWQDILIFLKIVSQVYPQYLQEQQLSDVGEYRIRKIRKLAELWRSNPPRQKIIAAGTTATQPAVAELLSIITGLPDGAVILPGLDISSTDDDFACFTVGHYQYGMKRFLDNVGISRDQVREWDADAAVPEVSAERLRLVTESLKPAELTEKWRFIEEFSPDALRGVHKIECNDEREEALTVALIMRHVLETPGKTAALVTSDVDLGKRVSLELERFGIRVNNSAGLALGHTPVGVFLNLVIAFCVSPSPVSLLALLKHPLAGAGLGDDCRNIARRMDRKLRGNSKVYTLEDLRTALDDYELQESFDIIVALANPLLEIGEQELSLEHILMKHIAVAEALAVSEENLWRGPDGTAMSALFSQLLQDAADFFAVSLSDYAKLFLQFQNQVLARRPYNTHKRLEILGPMESRLQHRDVVIIGSLNEGMFPQTEEPGPWMSYQMRIDFGLPSAKQRMGISASDFHNAFMAGEVFLTRSLKSGGAPTIASRWLQRLEAVIKTAGAKAAADSRWEQTCWRDYADIIDRPASRIVIVPASASPAVSVRPRKMSVSAIESLMKDPYAVYAKYILKLYPLDPLEPPIRAQDYGSAVHEVFAWFVQNYAVLPEDSLAVIQEKAKEVFKRDGISLFWLMRFNRASRWFIEELKNRPPGTVSYVELQGLINIGGIDITAIADRIDINIGGKASIIDYKTGAPPKDREVLAGYSPQLPIEAMIAQQGGFTGLSKQEVHRLLYYRISGKNAGAQIEEINPKGVTVAALIEMTHKGIERLVNAFYGDGIAYDARPDPLLEYRFSDYEHLERVKEWGTAGGGGI